MTGPDFREKPSTWKPILISGREMLQAERRKDSGFHDPSLVKAESRALQVASEGWEDLAYKPSRTVPPTQELIVPRDIPMVWLKGAWHLTHAFQGQSQNLALGTFPSPSTNKPDQILPVTRRGLSFYQRSGVQFQPGLGQGYVLSASRLSISPKKHLPFPLSMNAHISVCIHAYVCTVCLHVC